MTTLFSEIGRLNLIVLHRLSRRTRTHHLSDHRRRAVKATVPHSWSCLQMIGRSNDLPNLLKIWEVRKAKRPANLAASDGYRVSDWRILSISWDHSSALRASSLHSEWVDSMVIDKPNSVTVVPVSLFSGSSSHPRLRGTPPAANELLASIPGPQNLDMPKSSHQHK